jgi:hypothetical protein
MYTDGYLIIQNAYFLRDESANRPLALHPRSTSAMVVFRLLLGGVFIGIGKKNPIRQPHNYFILDHPISGGFTFNQEIIKAFPGLGQQDRNGNFLSYTIIRSLNDFFEKQGTNRGFFDVLTNEIARSFIASDSDNEIAAFVYLYRAIEHISYALPLFHARHEKNYMKAFNDMKKLITTGDGELKFCEKFINRMFSEDEVLKNHKYNFTYPSEYHEKYAKYLKTNHTKLCDCTGSSITIEFSNAFGFIVDIRNKFFHHLSGSNQSASSKDIIDGEAFFKPLNIIARSMISLILGRMISAEIE